MPCFLSSIQVFELLAEHLACWGCHVAFPELAFLSLTQLRKFAKHSPVDRFRQAGVVALRQPPCPALIDSREGV
jgi:hypothetical protein